MKAKELRLGNLINLYDDFNSTVTGFTDTGAVWFVPNPFDPECAWNILDIKPIELTEEWLLKLGFVKSKSSNDYYIDLDDYTALWIDLDSMEIEHESHYICKANYVHQLQNLYFALTGEELTVKE